MKKEIKDLLEKADRYLRSAELLLKDGLVYQDITMPCFTQQKLYCLKTI